ncbi:phospholipase D-like domain-containing protein [Polymorphospora rubra]|uniref:phospholipase D-like domain-containing protein n=1 Tax=Polymorphospora rubra TaxID=338584 RepID=UPI0033F3AC7A
MTDASAASAGPSADDVIDLGALPVSGAYFLARPEVPTRTPFLAAPGPATADGTDPAYRHCWTYAGGGSTIRRELVEMLDGARRKVFVASFFLGDAEVRAALCRAAERLRGGVYVISALDDRSLNRAINEVDDQQPVDKQTEQKRFEELTRQGIWVRGYEGCHAKFAVVDDQVALVSSANLTTHALDVTGENGVVVRAAADVGTLARLFARLWQGARWEMPPGDDPVVSGRTATSRAVRVDAPKPGATGPVWTFDDEHHIQEAIEELIDSAREELLLATFSLDSMTANPRLLLDPLRVAVDRGVRVSMLLRGRNNMSTHRADATALAELGVRLRPCRLNHAKGVIADRKRGALFSANFDARHGLTNGVEVGMRLDGTPSLDEAIRYFEQAMRECDLEFVRETTVRALTRLASPVCKPWPLPERLTVAGTDSDWQAMRRATADGGPALYSMDSDGQHLIQVGVQRWTLTPEADGGHRLTRATRQRRIPTAAALLDDWLSSRTSDRTRRGICPATLVRTRPDDSALLK